MRVRWAGESVNAVVPSAYIAGEAVKVQLLHRRGVPRMQAASSVVAGKTAQTLAQVAFIATGAAAGAMHLAPDSPARIGMIAIRCSRSELWCCYFFSRNAGCFARSVRFCRSAPCESR
jgi:hypothetical protein